MKKAIIITAICLFSASGIVKAQEFQKFRFGLQASPLIGWMNPETEDYKNDGIKMGFNWGGMVEYYFTKNYCIKTGFSITNIGGKLKYNDYWVNKEGLTPSLPTTPPTRIAGVLSRNYSLKYLEIPLGIKFKTNEIGYLTYFGHIGISTSFNTSAKADDTYDYVTPPATNVQQVWDKRDIKKDVVFFRESLLVGLGVEYGITKTTSLISSLTFNNGFTDILRGTNILVNKPHRSTSNYIELSIGVLF